MRRSDGKGRYVRNPTFRQQSISLMQPGAGETCRRGKSQMLQYVCVCVRFILCILHYNDTDTVWLCRCHFKMWCSMNFPEGIEMLDRETQAQKKKWGWLESFSNWNQSCVCLTRFFTNDKDSCVTRSPSLFDAGLVVRKTLVHGEYLATKTHIERTQCFHLCLEGPAALALMNWRGGSWSPTLTAMASLYRVRHLRIS